jgi:cyclopropane fatty-acyl-phospholipid synthase-like methyltransferase
MTDEPQPCSRFATAYEGTPPWDIGGPQPALVALADSGTMRGAVLDAGCGTGENALFCAARGHEVLGVDMVPKAVEAAQAKAAARGLAARASFLVHDALDLGALHRRFDTIIDSGLFHVFDDDARARYVTSLAAAMAAGGVYCMLCFSEREPADWGGPRRVTTEEIRAAFSGERGFRVRSVEPAVFMTNFHPHGGQAWLAVVEQMRVQADSPGTPGE